MHPKLGEYYLLCTFFRRNNEIAQVPTPLITFLVDEHHERRPPLSSYAIYHLSIPFIITIDLPCSLTCRYDNQPTSHFSGSDSLDARPPGLSPTMPLLAEVSPRTRLYAFVNPITRMKRVALKMK
jgi:hypothetical protein